MLSNKKSEVNTDISIYFYLNLTCW